MFILEDRRKKPVAQFVEEPSVMWHLLRGSNAQEYPMWHLLDDASSTWFSSDRMAELIADLEKLKSPAQVQARQLSWKQGLEDGIARLEAERAQSSVPEAPVSARRSPAHSPETLQWMRDCVHRAEQQPPIYPESLSAEAVRIQVNSLLALARRCRQIKGFLGHDPFAEPK